MSSSQPSTLRTKQHLVRQAVLGWACMCSGGCGRIQSALHPSGHEADTVAQLWWIMLIGSGLVLALVLALLVYALVRPPKERKPIHGEWFIFAGGVALPTLTLTALLVYSLGATRELRLADPADPFDIEIVGHQWWWEVRYLDERGERELTTANELHLPRGVRTRVKVSTVDVIHSFWAPTLAGKIDLIPGVDNEIILQPTQLGTYRAQCAEFCGIQHARMGLYVVVHDHEDFAAWRRRQSADAVSPSNALSQAGRDVFMDAACAWCHTIRGTPAQGSFGPDLTHVGSRRSIAAATLPANRAALGAWIVDAQHLKPGSRMPSFREFAGHELNALAAYLEELQ